MPKTITQLDALSLYLDTFRREGFSIKEVEPFNGTIVYLAGNQPTERSWLVRREWALNLLADDSVGGRIAMVDPIQPIGHPELVVNIPVAWTFAPRDRQLDCEHALEAILAEEVQTQLVRFDTHVLARVRSTFEQAAATAYAATSDNPPPGDAPASDWPRRCSFCGQQLTIPEA